MVELPGITSRSPIGFLAALGLLRVLAEDRGQQVALGWHDGRAVLEGITREEAIEELAANMAGREKAFEFTWADSTRKIPPETHRPWGRPAVPDEDVQQRIETLAKDLGL